MLKLAILDDDNADRQAVYDLLLKYSFEKNIEIEIDSYSDGRALMNEYVADKYHILFLDVELNDTINGIDIAHFIRNLPDHNVTIVYLSSFPEYMQKSFGVRPAQYFTKPVTYEHFVKQFDEIIQYDFQNNWREFETSKGKVYVNLSHIIYVSSDGHGGHENIMCTTDGDYTLITPLKTIQDMCSNCLVSPNRSDLVSTRHIREVKRYHLLMDNGATIPISKRRYNDFQIEISENIRKRITQWI